MRDYGRSLDFGYFPFPGAANYQQMQANVRLADELGLDLIGIQDHPYNSQMYDTWTLMATLVAQTKRIRFFPDVACLPLRPPAMLAKAAATLDSISGGRIELGLGAGAFWQAIEAMGVPARSPGEAVAALEEAIQLLRLLWSDQRAVRFKGAWYTANGIRPGPPPAHPIGIWIGAYKPKMLNLIGRLADGWLPSFGYAMPDQLLEAHEIIDAGAGSVGRDPTTIKRIYNISGVITSGSSRGLLNGPVEQWIEQLAQLTLGYGMDSYILAQSQEADPQEQLRRFALEVAPGVRELVARERGTNPQK